MYLYIFPLVLLLFLSQCRTFRFKLKWDHKNTIQKLAVISLDFCFETEPVVESSNGVANEWEREQAYTPLVQAIASMHCVSTLREHFLYLSLSLYSNSESNVNNGQTLLCAIKAAEPSIFEMQTLITITNHLWWLCIHITNIHSSFQQ